jgi:hypothetical protein
MKTASSFIVTAMLVGTPFHAQAAVTTADFYYSAPRGAPLVAPEHRTTAPKSDPRTSQACDERLADLAEAHSGHRPPCAMRSTSTRNKS